MIGVPKDQVVKFALRQADRQRLTDLIRTARGAVSADPTAGPGSSPPPPSPR